MFVPRFVTRIETPGTTALEASVTLPTTLAEDVCALAPNASTRAANNVIRTRTTPPTMRRAF